jgi:hypothetical protein
MKYETLYNASTPKCLLSRIFLICIYAILALARVGVTISSPISDSVSREPVVDRRYLKTCVLVGRRKSSY